MKKYEENMKYEGITLLVYEPWDLEKFRAFPLRWGSGMGGVAKYQFRGGVGENKDIKHVNLTCSALIN